MDFATTVLLGGFAGLTIYLGLPFARLQNTPRYLKAFLNALATGILVFLLWDVITKASEPVNVALDAAKKGEPSSFVTLLILFVVGFGVGLLSLVYFERGFIKRSKEGNKPGITTPTPTQLALMIAVGIGLHNFAEGLAIGQSSRSGAIELATILIIGFGLHNMTEGFGIGAPLAAGTRPTWAFLALAGLIAGGPTFLGTLLGFSVKSEEVFVLFLALAAGSIFYVVSELLHVGRLFSMRRLGMWGIFLGFLAGYGTDLIVTWGGA